MALRCLIVDNNSLFLDAARVVLEHGGITVVGVAATVAEALARAAESRPDVILVDIDLGTESGFDLARRLGDQTRKAPSDAPAARIVMISTRAEEDFEDLIAATPAVGFVAKSRLSATAVLHLLSNRKLSGQDGG